MNVYPLQGKRILVTRAHRQAAAFSREMIARGAAPIEIPVLDFRRPDERGYLQRILDGLSSFQWIVFTSANGVRFFFQALHQEQRALPQEIKVAVVGRQTLRVLREYGVDADVVPEEYVAEKLMEQLQAQVKPGEVVLMPRGNLARKFLAVELERLGAKVTDLIIYETVMDVESKQDLQELIDKRAVDVITFTSSSTVQFFTRLLDGIQWRKLIEDVRIACIGPVTAQTAKESGITVDIIASEYSTPGLLDAMEHFYQEGSS